MKVFLSCSLLLSGFSEASLDNEIIQKMIDSGNFKEAIKTIEKKKEKSSDLLVLLAKSYYKDQEHAKAFESFLEALKSVGVNQSHAPIQKEDELLYQEAIKIYLDPNSKDPATLSQKILDLYDGVGRLHPEYVQLGYLIAISYANLGKYPEFFDQFYKSYKKIPEHFLSFKTQAILHIKLYDRGKTPMEKDKQKQNILYFLKKAKEAYSNDPSLYKMEISFSKDKEQIIETNLKEILNKNIVIPRADLSFYLDQLLAYGKDDLTVTFLKAARKWYPYSRTLDAADKILQSKTDLK